MADPKKNGIANGSRNNGTNLISSGVIHRKIAPKIEHNLNDLLAYYPVIVLDIIQKIDEVGGRALLVGGAVRDLLLGIKVKDLDIEVHGLTVEQLESLLRFFGPVSLVGKSFGVLRIHGIDIDWSLPRTDSAGRKPHVEIRADLTIQEAFARRDLTMNAIGIDLVSHELLDPFNGLQDMQDKLLRVPDKDKFAEDPLRFYRVMQFIGRFEMAPDQELNNICETMDISDVSRERIEQEFEKLLLKSRRPSLGIRWLRERKRLAEILPEIAALIGVPQNPDWHPEGDVFEHTMQALDAAAIITTTTTTIIISTGSTSNSNNILDSDLESNRDIALDTGELVRTVNTRDSSARNNACDTGLEASGLENSMLESERFYYQNQQNRLILLYAALCHDIGKATATQLIDGVYRSIGHDCEGAVLTPVLLRRITEKIAIIDPVKKLVKYHMQPTQLVVGKAGAAAYKRLAHKLAPDVTMHMLGDLCLADKRGRNPESHEPLESSDEHIVAFIKKAQQAQVIHKAEKPILLGRDLLDQVAGGPKLGELVKRAYEIQLDQGITDKQELKRRVLEKK
jgi:hypothetical protein